MNLKKLGNFIADLRNEKGLTQVQLAQKLGIGDKSVSKWECGTNAPDISIINKLSEILGITATELLNAEKSNKEIPVDTIKFYNRTSKMKYIKPFSIIIMLITIFSLFIFIISNYNRFQLYNVRSQNDNFVITGYMIFNRKTNIVIIPKIDYIDKYVGTDEEIKAKSVQIFLKYDDKILYSSEYGIFQNNNVPYPIEEFLDNEFIFLDERIDNQENSLDYKTDTSHFFIEITYVSERDEIKKIKIPLILCKEISDISLFF